MTMWRVQTGKGKGTYTTLYAFTAKEEGRARMYYSGLNAFDGHKKRLLNPEGKVVARVISNRTF